MHYNECIGSAVADQPKETEMTTTATVTAASTIANTTGRTLLIGSNNAYSWYALIDADGSLVDVAGDAAVGRTMPEMVAEMLSGNGDAGYIGDFDAWEGSWADGDGETMFAEWADADEIGRLRVEDGEDAVLEIFGGAVEARITCAADAQAYIAAQAA